MTPWYIYDFISITPSFVTSVEYFLITLIMREIELGCAILCFADKPRDIGASELDSSQLFSSAVFNVIKW